MRMGKCDGGRARRATPPTLHLASRRLGGQSTGRGERVRKGNKKAYMFSLHMHTRLRVCRPSSSSLRIPNVEPQEQLRYEVAKPFSGPEPLAGWSSNVPGLSLATCGAFRAVQICDTPPTLRDRGGCCLYPRSCLLSQQTHTNVAAQY